MKYNYIKNIIALLLILFSICFAGCIGDNDNNNNNKITNNEEGMKLNTTTNENYIKENKSDNIETMVNEDKLEEQNTENDINITENKTNITEQEEEKPLTKEQLIEKFEKEYEKNAKVINKEHIFKDGNIKMTVVKHGKYTTFGKYNKTVKVYRLDIIIENINNGDEVEYLLGDPYIEDEYGNKYNIHNKFWTINITDILNIGESKIGYMLFECPPTTPKRLIFQSKFDGKHYEYIELQ